MQAPTDRTVPHVASRILTMRGQRVLLDADLAEVYGVETRALNQAVKRNLERFPQDFMFQLSPSEKEEVITVCDHLAKLKFTRALPYAFTEQGVAMPSSVLKSPRAIAVNIEIMRTFVQMRALSLTHEDLAKRLQTLEQKTQALSLAHDNFGQNTRAQLRQVFDALRALTMPPDLPKRPIGFTAN